MIERFLKSLIDVDLGSRTDWRGGAGRVGNQRHWG